MAERPKGGAMAEIARVIGDEIRAGQLAAGTQLRQDHLAARFAVSHIPVREAFRRLEAEGLVTLVPRRGAFVARMSAEDAAEVIEMRIALETLAVRLSVASAGRAVLDGAARTLDAADRSDEIGDWADLNWQFHRQLYGASARPRLLTTIESLWRHTDRYLRVVWQTADYQDKSQDEHRAILAAYRRRDVVTAERLTEDHIAEAGAVLCNAFTHAEAAA